MKLKKIYEQMPKEEINVKQWGFLLKTKTTHGKRNVEIFKNIYMYISRMILFRILIIFKGKKYV